MNYKLAILSVFCFAILSNEASAQLDRRIGGSRYEAPKGDKKNEKPDYTATAVSKLKEDLTLDGFQEAVVANLLNENQVKAEKIMAEDIPYDSKSDKLLQLNNQVREKIKEILTPEQLAKFEALGKKKKKK